MGAYLVSLAGVLSHLLLDWTNAYGVRLLEPFSSKWYSADITFVVDVWIWAAFLAAVAGPALSKLLSSEIGARAGSGKGAAIFALAFLVVYSLFRWDRHAQAVATLDSRLYNGAAAVRVAAFPTLANPFRWIGVVDGNGFYRTFDLNTLGQFDPTAGGTIYKAPPSPAINAARRTETFRIFLNFAQYPVWRVLPVSEPLGGSQVEAMDLRFGTPSQPRFVAEAVLDSKQKVVSSNFRFGIPEPAAR